MSPTSFFMIHGKFDFECPLLSLYHKIMNLSSSTWLNWEFGNEAWADPMSTGDYLHSMPEKGFLFPPLPECKQERMLCGHYTTPGSYLENQSENNCQKMEQICI